MKFNVKGISAISLLSRFSLTDVCSCSNRGVIGAGHLFVLHFPNLIWLCRHNHPLVPKYYVPCVHLEFPASFYFSSARPWGGLIRTFPPITEAVCWRLPGIWLGIQKRVWWKSRTFITQLFGALFIPSKLHKILLQLVCIHGRRINSPHSVWKYINKMYSHSLSLVLHILYGSVIHTMRKTPRQCQSMGQ